TLLLISHDRYFLDKLVGRTIELKNSELIEYWGNYSYYIWKRYRRPDTPGYQEEEEGRTRPVSGKKTKEQKRMEAEARQAVSNKRRRLQKSVDSFEKDIKIAESEKLKIETVLAWPVTYRNGSDVKALHVAHADLKKRIDALYDRWEQEKLKLKELINKIN
ncbi:MAG: ABC transporter, partial [Candidatus Aminicenantes bacterium]|nr:ABC transporter [Candidatus Aminicenantes bacterium]